MLDARKPAHPCRRSSALRPSGRDAAETLDLFKRFRSGLIGLVSVAEHVDFATPHGDAMAQVGAVFAELERALIAVRTAEALAELRRQGRVWNDVPFGWQAVDGQLVPDAAEQETLARARDLRVAGMGYASIAKTLTEEGRPTKRGRCLGRDECSFRASHLGKLARRGRLNRSAERVLVRRHLRPRETPSYETRPAPSIMVASLALCGCGKSGPKPFPGTAVDKANELVREANALGLSTRTRTRSRACTGRRGTGTAPVKSCGRRCSRGRRSSRRRSRSRLA